MFCSRSDRWRLLSYDARNHSLIRRRLMSKMSKIVFTMPNLSCSRLKMSLSKIVNEFKLNWIRFGQKY